MLYIHLLLRKQHVKCGPPADRLDGLTVDTVHSQLCVCVCGGGVSVKIGWVQFGSKYEFLYFYTNIHIR